MSDTAICTSDPSISVRFIANDKGNPPGKLADAELHFTTGLLHGLKLIGFSVWQRRATNGEALNVTFPARSYSVNGDRRSFALLRPTLDTAQTDRVRDAILDAYRQHVQDVDDASRPVCPNCGQWQRHQAMGLGAHLDCLNECVRRGFAAAR